MPGWVRASHYERAIRLNLLESRLTHPKINIWSAVAAHFGQMEMDGPPTSYGSTFGSARYSFLPIAERRFSKAPAATSGFLCKKFDRRYISSADRDGELRHFSFMDEKNMYLFTGSARNAWRVVIHDAVRVPNIRCKLEREGDCEDVGCIIRLLG